MSPSDTIVKTPVPTPTPVRLGATRRSSGPVQLSEAALDKVRRLLEEEEDSTSLALRVAVRPSGCSGYSYELFFDTERADDDLIAELEGVRVAVDAESAPLLRGATLDYRDGLNQAGFHLSNPNARRTCGCGQSFS